MILKQPCAGLLARRNHRTSEIAYYLTWTATPVPLATLVALAGMRWKVEETFQGTKELAALDEHQVRTWTSWHRWVTLAMLAYAFLAITRTTDSDRTDPDLIPLTCNEIRHLLISAVMPHLNWEHRARWSAWRRRHQATRQTPPLPATRRPHRLKTQIRNWSTNLVLKVNRRAGREPCFSRRWKAMSPKV